MKKTLRIILDNSGLNIYDNEHSPDIIKLIKSPDISYGKLGTKYKYANTANIEKIKAALNKDKSISAFFPIYIKYIGEEIDALSLEKFESSWDSGIGGYIAFNKSILKENLNFERVSRKKKFSKERRELMFNYSKEKLKLMEAFITKKVYIVLEEENGIVINSEESVIGYNNSQIIDNSGLVSKEDSLDIITEY